jgi:hypothetical protein
MDISRYISIGGILTTIAVLFQSAPLFLPVLGLALSPLSTLPIAIAAVLNVSLGFTVFFSSVLILTMFSVQETIIMFFTTGLLGIVMGTFLYRKGLIISILFSSIALSLGMISLTYVIRISSFVDFTNSLSTYLIFIIFFIFSFVYASIWNICFRKFMDYLIKIID